MSDDRKQLAVGDADRGAAPKQTKQFVGKRIEAYTTLDDIMIHMRITLTISPTRSRILHTNLQFIEEVKLVSVKTASTTTVVPTFEAACYYFGIVYSPPPPQRSPTP